MKTWFEWYMMILNPIVIWTMVPIPLVQYGHFTWAETFESLLVYTILWLAIWIYPLSSGRKVTLGE